MFKLAFPVQNKAQASAKKNSPILTGGRVSDGSQTRRGLLCGPEPRGGQRTGRIRPVLIIQNDIGNRYSPTVIAAAITSRQDKNKMLTHINIKGENAVLPRTASCCWSRCALTSAACTSARGASTRPTSADEALNVSFGLNVF